MAYQPAANPDWPLIEDAVSFLVGPTAAPNPTSWVNLTSRTEGTATTKRGRNYELDQVQAGQAALTVQNTDGALDPENVAGPFYPGVKLYRSYRKRAQYPATINLLTASQATAGQVTYDVFGTSSSLAAGVLPTWVTSPSSYTLSTDGAGHYTNAIPSSPAANTVLSLFQGFSFAPGQNMTAQFTVTSTAAVTVQVVWRTTLANGSQLITSGVGSNVTASSTPTVVSSNFTTPSNVVGLEAGIRLVSGSAACTLSTSTAQVQSGTLSTYVQPGVWYPMFTGFVERWPQSWSDGGTYGTSSLTAVDAFGWLSQRPLHCAAYHEILNLSPTFAYFLDEPSGATSFVDATGAMSALYPSTGQAAAPTLITAGSSLAANPITTGYLPTGIGGPVVTFANVSDANTVIGVLDATSRGAVGPPTATAWTRLMAFKVTTMPTTSGAYLWFGLSLDIQNAIALHIGLDGSVYMTGLRAGSSTFGSTVFAPAGSVQAGDWHMLALTVSADGKTVTPYFDGVTPGATVYGTDQRPLLKANDSETFGGDIAGGTGFQGFVGDMALLAEYPVALTATQVSSIYSAFRYGGSGLGVASSATRYQDILRWAAWQGAQSEDSYTSGQTVAYGPATELNASRDQAGTDVVSALQTVVDTENGEHYAARDGSLTLKARRARYNLSTPVVIFGENAAGGEIPYVDAQTSYDPARLANDSAVTQTFTGAVFRSINASSSNDYGDVQIQRRVNSLNPLEVDDASQYLVNRYSTPRQRIETVTVDVSAIVGSVPTIWPLMLALEEGQRARVIRRPPSPAATVQVDGFIEGIAWNFTDQVSATVTFQISATQSQQFWELGSTRMSLKTLTTVGATSMTVNPLADAATNPIQANIHPDSNNYAWIIDYGLATAELFMISGVTAGSTGYTSAAMTVGSTMRLDTGATGTGFQFGHAANAVIQDIGGLYLGAGSAFTSRLAQYCSPAGALDALSTLDSTTIVGY